MPPPLDLPLSPAESAWELYDPFLVRGLGRSRIDRGPLPVSREPWDWVRRCPPTPMQGLRAERVMKPTPAWGPGRKAGEGIEMGIGEDEGGPRSGSDPSPQKRHAHLPPPLAGARTSAGARGRLSPLSSHRCRRHAAHGVCCRQGRSTHVATGPGRSGDTLPRDWPPPPGGPRLPRPHWVLREALSRPRAPIG